MSDARGLFKVGDRVRYVGRKGPPLWNAMIAAGGTVLNVTERRVVVKWDNSHSSRGVNFHSKHLAKEIDAGPCMKPLPISEHAYVSTACHHGLHDQCRRRCKFCEIACSCPCHGSV